MLVDSCVVTYEHMLFTVGMRERRRGGMVGGGREGDKEGGREKRRVGGS